MDITLFSVGGLSTQALISRRGIDVSDGAKGLHDTGAVRDLLCQLVDKIGEVMDPPIDQHVMTINLQPLGRYEIGTASGGA